MASCSCAERQRFAGGHAQLPLDQIEPGDHLGHRMLDLQPGVHLHEVELVRLVGDELHRAGVHVSDGARRGHRSRSHLAAARRRHAGGGRFLQHFLVAPLHRAVAFEQINRVAVSIGEHLHLDVTRAREILLQQHALVAEGGGCLALGGRRAHP